MSHYVIEEYQTLSVLYEVTEFEELAASVPDSLRFFIKKQNKEKLTRKFLEEVDKANKTEPGLGSRLTLFELVESVERKEVGTYREDDLTEGLKVLRAEPSLVYRLDAKIGLVRNLEAGNGERTKRVEEWVRHGY